jgi:hypothetical protein
MATAGAILQTETKRPRDGSNNMSRAQNVMTNLLAAADIRINGDRPWDIHVHDRRFFGRVLASGTLGFGESYMDGWWDCDALDEMSCRIIRVGLENVSNLRFLMFGPFSPRFSRTSKLPGAPEKSAGCITI